MTSNVTAAAGTAPTSPARVSLCLALADEAGDLAACLRCVADLVQEIVIAAPDPAGGVREIVDQFRGKLVSLPSREDLAAARNEALSRATGDWVLSLDVADQLDEDNRGRLRDLLTGLPDELCGYAMRCECSAPDDDGSATVGDQVRLFRRHPRGSLAAPRQRAAPPFPNACRRLRPLLRRPRPHQPRPPAAPEGRARPQPPPA